MGTELARQRLKLEETDLNGFVTFSTTHSAYERLIASKPNPTASILSQNTAMDPEHPVDLILATAPSDEEQALAVSQGVDLVVEPFCLDAFVFIVNSDNPIDSLTSDQIRQIYAGEISDWADLGSPTAARIEAYQRPKNSGSQTAMEQLVMRGAPLSAAQANYISDGMAELVAQVGNHDNGRRAIGYSYLHYVEGLYKSGAIKVLAVDGVQPSPENLRSRPYPYTTAYNAVYRQGEALPADFVQWMLSDQGQQSIAQAGYYIPLREQ